MISTGLDSLDKILGGGIRESAVTDIYGSSGVGKTQLLMQISLYSALHGPVLFQDTTGDFRPERMRQMIANRNLEYDLMSKIQIMRLGSTAQQLHIMHMLEHECTYSALVIDNVTDLFSYEYARPGSHLQRFRALGQYMHALSRIAMERNIPVLVSNVSQVVSGIETERMVYCTSPFAHYRIGMFKSGGTYKGQVESLHSCEGFAYKISPAGICDA